MSPSPAPSTPPAPAPAPEDAPTVNLISLGCPRTLVDSEVYLGSLQQAGFRIISDSEHADVAIINTCSFIQESIKESIDTVLQAVALKKQGKVKAVIVAGCLVQRFKDELIKELPEVDGFVGVDGFSDIRKVVEQVRRGGKSSSLRRRPQTMSWEDSAYRSPLTPSHYAYLKISEGCLKGCTFCVIPKIKGPLTSRKLESLIEEATQLVEQRGVKELIVVGQDTSDYGVDLYRRPRIAELLRKLAAINGVEWIRLLYCHPHGVTEEIIDTLRDEPKLCKYLDMAIEHSDTALLARMNRLVTEAALRETIGRLRARVPGIALRTSIIVGFPGETDAAFDGMLGFLRDVKFDRLGAFTYSREQGSASYNYSDQVPQAVMQARFNRLMQAQQEIAAELNQGLIGQTIPVMIDETDADEPAQYLGRSRADCPDVDGAVFVTSERPLARGTIVPVRVTDSYEYDLIGTAEPA